MNFSKACDLKLKGSTWRMAGKKLIFKISKISKQQILQKLTPHRFRLLFENLFSKVLEEEIQFRLTQTNREG